jgi:diguanylate cyclase (GGDEF)-like protein/PAS domain S-box-containing protein
LIEDNPGDAHLVRRYLSREPQTDFQVEHANRVGLGLDRLRQNSVDLVLLDLNLPDSRGLDTFETVYASFPSIPMIVMTGQDDRAQAVEAVRKGAQDYLVKGKVDTELLVRAIRYALERRRSEDQLRESQERYELAVQGAKDGIWDWNLETDEVFFSPRWKEMLGYEEAEIGNRPEDWFNKVHPADLDNLRKDLSTHLQGRSPHFECEHRILHRTGRFRWVLARAVAVPDPAGEGGLRIAGSLSDIHDRKTHEQRLEHDAMHDPLTKLPNAVLLLDRLSVALAQVRRRSDYRFAVLFFDLDRFKSVNDSLGHAMGDRLLVTVAKRLQALLRPGDTVARLGGDEFAIVANGIEEPADATRIADRIHEELQEPIDLEGQEVSTSASIGITLSSDGYKRPKDMLRDADTAMYRAKSLGRARYALFDEEMHHHAEEALRLESDLRQAVEERQFEIHYQPIVSLESGELEGLEALVRWQHPQRGLLVPGDFLKVAEETGIIAPIGWQVLKDACRQMATWHRQLPFTELLAVSVNVSNRQLVQTNFVGRIETILEQSGFHPSKLRLEINEQMLLEDPEATLDKLGQLATLGVQLYLDDFGTGNSSLRRLHRLPPGTIKIDRDFIAALDDSSVEKGMVETLVGLARSLGMGVIAEGLETPQQLSRVRRLECEFGQGFYFSRPLNAEDARTLIARRPRW